MVCYQVIFAFGQANLKRVYERGANFFLNPELLSSRLPFSRLQINQNVFLLPYYGALSHRLSHLTIIEYKILFILINTLSLRAPRKHVLLIN